MDLNEELLREWFHAVLLDNCNRSNTATMAFKAIHPQEYCLLHSFYRLRHELNDDITLMSSVGSVHWFTLTFDNKHDKSLVSSKRKSATRFLNDIFLFYEMIEEYGEDNNRYHIHGFGVYRENKGFKDFVKWHSRTKIQDLSVNNLKKKVKYLTKYAVKSLPRIRRSKNLCFLRNENKRYKGLKLAFPTCYTCHLHLSLLKAHLGVYN